MKGFPFRATCHRTIKLVAGGSDVQMSIVIRRPIVSTQWTASGRYIAKYERTHRAIVVRIKWALGNFAY